MVQKVFSMQVSLEYEQQAMKKRLLHLCWLLWHIWKQGVSSLRVFLRCSKLHRVPGHAFLSLPAPALLTSLTASLWSCRTPALSWDTSPASHLKTLSCLQAMDNSPSTCSGPWKYDMSWSKQTRGVLSFTSALAGFVLLSGDLFSILFVVPCSYLEIHSDGSSWAFSLFAGCHLAVLSFC